MAKDDVEIWAIDGRVTEAHLSQLRALQCIDYDICQDISSQAVGSFESQQRLHVPLMCCLLLLDTLHDPIRRFLRYAHIRKVLAV